MPQRHRRMQRRADAALLGEAGPSYAVRMRTACLLLCLCSAAGCGGSSSTPDGGRDAAAAFDAGTDAGASGDAGASQDASASEDAGASEDGAAPGQDAGADGGGSDGGSFDGGAPTCAFVDDLERGCGADANCVVGVHQTDCCGNTHAVGMNHSERDRFDAAEAACRATYPACGCPAGPTTTDSGETAFDASAIQVGCIQSGASRVCTTYVSARPADTP